MKFIHTSDWHIGRQFQNISLLDDQLHVLKQLKSYAKEHQVDAILIAGDIFDRTMPPADAVAALDGFLNQLRAELPIPIIMISGNHDSAERLGFGSMHMKESGLHILSDLANITTPVVIESKEGPVHVYGIPFNDPVQVREAFNCDVKTYDEAHTYLADKIQAARIDGVPSILMSHCFIDGAQESDSEKHISIGGADRVSYQPLESFDYVALGHLHAPQSKGEEHIRYSGSLLKYSFSEYKQKKGITIVELDSNGLVSYKHHDLQPKHDMRVLEGTLEDILQQGQTDKHKDDYIFARLTDKKDILDPIGQLRKVYPNTLQLERTQFILSNGSRLVADVSHKRSEADVFKDFYEQVMGHDLTDEQCEVLQEAIAEVKTAAEYTT